MTVNLTAAEASMVLYLLSDNEDTGEYYGDPRQWAKRRTVLIEKLIAAVRA